jgi:hypothetical protein
MPALSLASPPKQQQNNGENYGSLLGSLIR